MTRVHEVSRDDLVERRKKILDRLEVSFEELAAKAESYSLMADERTAWEEIKEIDFLLAGG